MLEKPLHLASIALTLFVLAGVALFAIDETRDASVKSRQGIASAEPIGGTVAPTTRQERDRERLSGDVREFIDDVNDVVLSPFASLGENSDSVWVQRGIPATLGLLVYGFGLAMLARFSRGRP